VLEWNSDFDITDTTLRVGAFIIALEVRRIRSNAIVCLDDPKEFLRFHFSITDV
jgi:hypothetical protein